MTTKQSCIKCGATVENPFNVGEKGPFCEGCAEDEYWPNESEHDAEIAKTRVG